MNGIGATRRCDLRDPSLSLLLSSCSSRSVGKFAGLPHFGWWKAPSAHPETTSRRQWSDTILITGQTNGSDVGRQQILRASCCFSDVLSLLYRPHASSKSERYLESSSLRFSPATLHAGRLFRGCFPVRARPAKALAQIGAMTFRRGQPLRSPRSSSRRRADPAVYTSRCIPPDISPH